MNNTGHAVASNDHEAVRKAQHEWRLQKRRELEAKARKKHIRMSISPTQLPRNPHASPNSAVSAAAAVAEAVVMSPSYARQYAQPSGAVGTIPAVSHALAHHVGVLREKPTSSHLNTLQLPYLRAGAVSRVGRMRTMMDPQRDHIASHPVSTSAALMPFSSGVPLQAHPAASHPSVRPVAPRPDPDDIHAKHPMDISMQSHLDDRHHSRYAMMDASKLDGVTLLNAKAGHDPHHSAMLPTTAGRSTHDAFHAAAAAASVAASATIPGVSISSGVHVVDDATRLRLEQLVAQRRWREEKRRELALKRAKGSNSKRGRKRTKLTPTPTSHQQVVDQAAAAAVAAAAAGITPCAEHARQMAESVPTSIPGITVTSTAYPASIGAQVAVSNPHSIAMSTGLHSDSHMGTLQIGMQGGYLSGGHSPGAHVHSAAMSVSAPSAVGVNDGHLSAEDAATMYVQMPGSNSGAANLQLDTGVSTGMPMSASGNNLVEAEVGQGVEHDSTDAGVSEVVLPEANAEETAVDNADSGIDVVDARDTSDQDIAKATEEARAEVERVDAEAVEAEMNDDAMVGVEDPQQSGDGEQEEATEGVETGEDRGDEDRGASNSQNRVDDNGGGIDADESVEMKPPADGEDAPKDAAEAECAETGGNEMNDSTGAEEVTKGKDDGEHDDSGIEGQVKDADRERTADAENGNADGEAVAGTEHAADGVGKDEEVGATERFQVDNGEDIMTADAWQSLDSINP